MPIPADLRDNIDNLLAGHGLAVIRAAADAMSARYRRAGGARDFQIKNAEEAMAYAATRMPATFGAVAHVLRQLPADFAPVTMLDAGCGPGTATFAARDRFASLDHVTLLEPNAHLRGVARTLGVDGAWVESDISTAATGYQAYELVIASYVLNELNETAQCAAMETLWTACGDMMVVIEPGTPEGSAVIQRVRDFVISRGGFMVAPCPQSGVCPLRGMTDRWCHFSTRVERSRLHRAVKGAALGYEDEKFSYVIFSRAPVPLPAGRVLGHVPGAKVLRVQMCDSTGREGTAVIPKSDPRYKAAKRLDWGDAADFPLETG